MTQRCFVPNCNSGHETNGNPIAFFNVPTNDDLRKKWTNAIPKTGVPLYRTDLVCEKHFSDSDIIKHHKAQESTGNSIQKMAYDYPRLTETAVPSIFPDFELRLNQPKVENSPQRIAGQNASDLPYNYSLPPTAPPELDTITTNLATRVDDVIPDVTSHPTGWNVISEDKNPPLGWIIPEVTKHSPDSKVNKPEGAENYVPISKALMGQETSYNVANPMNDYNEDAKNQRKYDLNNEYKNNDPVITHEPVTIHPTTTASVTKRRNTNYDDCENCRSFCQCFLVILQCVQCCFYCIECLSNCDIKKMSRGIQIHPKKKSRVD